MFEPFSRRILFARLEHRLGTPAMNIADSITRLSGYHTRHGFWATLRRAGVAARRSWFSGRMALFYCELSCQIPPPEPREPLEVEPKRNEAEIEERDFREMISFWNPKLARRKMKERFQEGATLWLIRSESRLAGYGWTLKGKTIRPHYFRLAPDDVHFFDFHVYPEYRGRGINPLLVSHILHFLSRTGAGRAFIEAAEWNHAQLLSLSKTPFRPLGWARMISVPGGSLVWWGSDSDAHRYQAGLRTGKEAPG